MRRRPAVLADRAVHVGHGYHRGRSKHLAVTDRNRRTAAKRHYYLLNRVAPQLKE